ncbi:MAG: PilZ domain-containing protein [Planctomycetes bacterium]|nr:PilZ domain-containing protein [Planctomycetota bacterium]
MPIDSKTVSTRSLTAKAYESLLETLDTQKKAPTRKVQRQQERVRLHRDVTVLCKLNPDSIAPTHFAVKSRNISGSGIGFFHGAFLAPGTACEIVLITPDRKSGLRVMGKVAQCRHIKAFIHEVGIKFDEACDVQGLVEPGANAAA